MNFPCQTTEEIAQRCRVSRRCCYACRGSPQKLLLKRLQSPCVSAAWCPAHRPPHPCCLHTNSSVPVNIYLEPETTGSIQCAHDQIEQKGRGSIVCLRASPKPGNRVARPEGRPSGRAQRREGEEAAGPGQAHTYSAWTHPAGCWTQRPGGWGRGIGRSGIIEKTRLIKRCSRAAPVAQWFSAAFSPG